MDADLIFGSTPIAGGLVELAFGATDTPVVPPGPDPVLATDLIFSQPPITAGPVELVFGATDTPALTDATVSIAAVLPGLCGSVGLALVVSVSATAKLPGLTGSVGVVYRSDTARPTVGQVQARAQEATATECGLTQPEQHALTINTAVTTRAQETVYAHVGITPTFSDALRTDAASSTTFQDGQRAPSPQLSGRFQDGLRDTSPRIQGRFQDGQPVPARMWGRFQDCLHDRRPSITSRWQTANPLHKDLTDRAGYARPLHVYRAGRFQEARRPPAGIHTPPVTPPIVPPYWGTELLFACPPITDQSVDLIFGLVCKPTSTHALLQILPARFYMTTHTIFAQRLPDLADIPIFEATVAADSGSYCWSLSASGPASLFEQLAPVGGLPAHIKVTLDGIPFVFAVDSLARTKSFGQTGVRVQGRSVTALIAAPYLRASTRANATDMTAQQIALDALASTGIDLDWGIGAGAFANGGLVDWLVPTGAWSHQGTPLDAVQAVVQAAGGYLQSHRSAATLLARHPYGQRMGDNPGAPWGWMTGPADVELATDALITEGVERKDGADINGVYVSGTSAGVLAMVKRTATAGDKLAAMVTDPLITHVDAARQRGLSILGAAGHKFAVSLDLPVLTGAGQPGVLDVGQLVQINAAQPWRARVRSVSVQAKQPTLRQTITLERHLETV